MTESCAGKHAVVAEEQSAVSLVQVNPDTLSLETVKKVEERITVHYGKVSIALPVQTNAKTIAALVQI